jgi:hypothetical protein
MMTVPLLTSSETYPNLDPKKSKSSNNKAYNSIWQSVKESTTYNIQTMIAGLNKAMSKTEEGF